jgi:peroxiredoxin
LNRKQFLSIALSLTILSLVWIIITPIVFPPEQVEASLEAPHRGFYAPGFALETPQGEIHTLEDYRGRPVLVFLWASWCTICKSAMPGLEAVYQAYESLGFSILAVNTSFQDTLPAAMEYFQTQRFSFTMLLDRDGKVATAYRMHAVPTSVLVGPDGIVTDVIIGSGISEGFLRSRLDSIFAEGTLNE